MLGHPREVTLTGRSFNKPGQLLDLQVRCYTWRRPMELEDQQGVEEFSIPCRRTRTWKEERNAVRDATT